VAGTAISGLGGVDAVNATASPTTITYPTSKPLPWNSPSIGGGKIVNAINVITDSTGTLFFICNQDGITGASEPSWNTAFVGQNTVDGTAVWSYLGLEIYVAPFYTTAPAWTEPFIGGGHRVTGNTIVTDSSGVHIFRYFGSSQFGITGMTEPAWNTATPNLSQTTDGTVTWVYGGLNPSTAGQELLVVCDAFDSDW
jgi:hypothetical protein